MRGLSWAVVVLVMVLVMVLEEIEGAVITSQMANVTSSTPAYLAEAAAFQNEGYQVREQIPTYPAEYEAWKNEFGLKFLPEEEQYRELIFSDNYQQILIHNSDLHKLYSMKLNQFASYSKQEFSEIFLTVKAPPVIEILSFIQREQAK